VLQRDVAPGIHRLEDAHTNFYVVEDDGALTIVDACVPTSWPLLEHAVRELGRSLTDIRALILTHAHFDHIGIAERMRSQLDVPVYVHENDVPLTKHPRQYGRERSPAWYMATQLQALPIVLGFVRARAFWPSKIGAVTRFEAGALDVPGRPHIVFTPGHTLGHVAFHFPDRDTLIAGDAVVTFDPYVAKPGPQIVSRAATADVERAFGSLDAIAATGARTVLTGHGEPWTDGADAIASRARSAGVT
jgi:glyoxylase-like metal-dependent hydrolase (beta-lactamase superfamily II)